MAETEKFETIRYTADVIALTPAREVLLIQGAGRWTRAPGRSRGFITQVGCRANDVSVPRTPLRGPPDRDQAVEDVDDELGRGAWLRTRLVSRRSAPCAYQVTDAQRWLGPPVSRCLR